MARDWKPRQPPAKTSLTEIARRYHAAAVALSQTLGLSVQEVLSQHRESVTAIFIESGRCELRLPAGVKLPPLNATSVEAENGKPPDEPVAEVATPVASPNGQGVDTTVEGSAPPATPEVVPREGTPVPDLPTTIPAGLPCAGQAIVELKPPHLRMLLSKVDQLAAAEGRRWQPLLEALTAERQRRLAQGHRPKPSPVAGEGHGA